MAILPLSPYAKIYYLFIIKSYAEYKTNNRNRHFRNQQNFNTSKKCGFWGWIMWSLFKPIYLRFRSGLFLHFLTINILWTSPFYQYHGLWWVKQLPVDT